MDYVCGDNRFGIIERYKNELISATNIESSPDEMAVLDNILFRFWQMGWLKEQEAVKPKSKVRHGANAQIQHFCGNCMKMLHGKPKFCSECGRPILWKGR